MKRIEPIAGASVGGYPIVIKAFEAAHRDCNIGDMQTPEAGLQQGRWNVLGVMQNATPACNLDIRQPELAELAQLIRKLKASPSP